MPQSSVVYPWNNKPLLPIERGIPTHEEMRLAELRRKEFLQAKNRLTTSWKRSVPVFTGALTSAKSKRVLTAPAAG
ncbi:hypothetical protein SODG_002002 [Sodalis praecaptivus]